MKLPGWLVVTLLTASLLAALSAGTWWWVTWPERMARAFVRAINAKELNAHDFMGTIPGEWKLGDAHLVNRNAAATACGQRIFWLDGVAYGFLAERGTIFWVRASSDTHPLEYQPEWAIRESFWRSQ